MFWVYDLFLVSSLVLAPFHIPWSLLKPKSSIDIHMDRGEKADVRAMCQSCVEIDKRIDRHRESLRSTTDPAETERINRLITQLYVDRVLFHKNPEK
jgi:hypothetical protein